MPLIVDTFNVLHTGGILPPELAEYGDVEGLVRLLGLSRWRGERVELVCDGSPPRPPQRSEGGSGVVAPPEEPSPDEASMLAQRFGSEGHPDVNVRYSGPGREADEVIATLIRHSTAPRSLTIVSSDGEVLRAARRRKCRTLTSQQFLEQLALDCAAAGLASPASVLKPPGALTGEQVEAWMNLFDVDEAEAQRLAQRRAKEKERRVDDAQGSEGDAERAPRNREVVLPAQVIEEAERLLRERRGE